MASILDLISKKYSSGNQPASARSNDADHAAMLRRQREQASPPAAPTIPPYLSADMPHTYYRDTYAPRSNPAGDLYNAVSPAFKSLFDGGQPQGMPIDDHAAFVLRQQQDAAAAAAAAEGQPYTGNYDPQVVNPDFPYKHPTTFLGPRSNPAGDLYNTVAPAIQSGAQPSTPQQRADADHAAFLRGHQFTPSVDVPPAPMSAIDFTDRRNRLAAGQDDRMRQLDESMNVVQVPPTPAAPVVDVPTSSQANSVEDVMEQRRAAAGVTSDTKKDPSFPDQDPIPVDANATQAQPGDQPTPWRDIPSTTMNDDVGGLSAFEQAKARQEAPDDGIASIPTPWRDIPSTTMNDQVGGLSAFEKAKARQENPPALPKNADDWSLFDVVRPGNNAKYQDARQYRDDIQKPTMNRHEDDWYRGPVQGPPRPPAAKPTPNGAAVAQEGEGTPNTAGQNVQLNGYVQVDPNSGGQGPSLGMNADDVMAQKKIIDSIYPNRTYDDAAQNRADKYAEGEMSRTKALAQLALFAGITKGAGGDWEGVGQGFASAGSQYTSGFDRYSKALQSKATRANERSDQKYSDGVSRTDAAVKLYAQNQALKEKYADNLRAGYKDKQDDIDKYYTTYIQTLKPEGGMPMSPEDSQRREDAMKEWQDSKAAGYIIRTHNVPKDAK